MSRFWNEASERAAAGGLLPGEVVKVKKFDTALVTSRRWLAWEVVGLVHAAESGSVAVYDVRRLNVNTLERTGRGRRGAFGQSGLPSRIVCIAGDQVLAFNPAADPFAGLPTGAGL